jgi:hypothetical protein
MKSSPEPEIISPQGRTGSDPLRDENLNTLATLLDEIFRIPGTRIRFGLDPLLGLVPGLGDGISGLLSLLIVTAAWQRGLPRVTLGRMVANVAVDSILGAIPFVGDVFDVAWKANRRNMALLERASSSPRRQAWHDWLFLGALFVIVLLLATLPFLVAIAVIRALAK